MEVELNPTSEKACEIVALETPSEDGLAEPEDEERTVPAAGMVFDSVNSALEFYRGYGKRMGFGVSIRNSTLSRDGTYQRVRLACTREGFPRSKNPRKGSIFASQKAGCKAKMTLVQTLDGDGSYVVTLVTLEHSHDLSPSKGRHFRCNRSISLGVRRTLEINDNAGIRVCRNYLSIVQEYGGYENMGFSERDCRNYLDQQRRLRIAEGDGEAVCRYFEVMKFQSPNFYSKIAVDSERRVTNLFWADGRTRATYEYFNDVVAFDMTYLTNRYDMPFAPFCGVNHHGQTIMLGCGLLANETIESFVWLFSTWLDCMGGVKPKAIITDQGRAIRKAVQIVFPATRHCWCMWHIRQKLPQKLAAMQRYRELENTFSSLIYHCNDRNEFEQKWQVMIEEHDLVENQWLKDIFEEREMWAPPFLTDHFWAGMSSTQRSEGLNAFFDGFVHGQTTLNTFVEQYALAQRRKMEKEAEADFQSYKSVVQCVTILHYEKQFQAAYTQAKFIKIQEELKDMLGIFSEVVEEEGQCKIFQCEEGNGGMEKVTFHVEKIEFTCTCRCFQFRGIVCRHAFAVLLQQRVKEVNSIYILDRWRKDITRRYNYEKFVSIAYDKRPEMERYDELRHVLLHIAEIGSEIPKMVTYVKNNATEMVEVLSSWKTNIENQHGKDAIFKSSTSTRVKKRGTKVPNCPRTVYDDPNITEKLPVMNPTHKKRRGRPTKNRIKTLVEKVFMRKKR
ncbi:hypothetical protein SLE2022_260400 [Rubroshorea leprosula]